MKQAAAAVELWFGRILTALVIALFGVLLLLVVWQVFTRLVLNAPSAWTEEAARFTFVWVSFIGIAVVVGQKADVVMDFLVERLPRQLQRGADIVAYLATLAFVLYALVYGGGKQAILAWGQSNPILPVTQGQLYLALPIAGILFSLYIVLHISRTLSPGYSVRSRGHEDPEAASI
ncbi:MULTISPECIES: TRAP transporter small permease [unclassified Pseudoclavibacter]|uniref:TRAP transporter small permease n=1 Tax=unclassified Pseudoclavibacter TaxID=2615177 RepID=UPI001BA4EC3A|nr:TRAP transporter small permease [Pseudoclavibacter sp. Marseille-Q4354]MBS3180093.1 TRAP transporter small permease [Pseudoclavibacter sp. Marseille-Q4354]